MRRMLQLALFAMTLALALFSAGCNSTWVSSGLLYIEQGNYAKAEHMFRLGLWYNEEEAAAHYQLAYALAYRAENDHMPIDEVDSARIKISEAHEHFLLAAMYAPETYGYNPDAEDELDREPAENGISSMYARMFNEAVRYNKNGHNPEAITYFELAKLADPRGKRGFDADLLLGQLKYNQYLDQEDETKMSELYDEISKLSAFEGEDYGRDAADLVTVKANILHYLNRSDEASALYEQLLLDNPEDLKLIVKVAETRASSGNRTGAGELYEQALGIVEFNGDMIAADKFKYFYTAMRNYYSGEMYPACIDLCNRIMDFTSSDDERARVLERKALSHFQLEEYDLAIEASEKIILDGGFDPSSLNGWQVYYQSLSKVNRTAEAQTARVHFIELRDGASSSN